MKQAISVEITSESGFKDDESVGSAMEETNSIVNENKGFGNYLHKKLTSVNFILCVMIMCGISVASISVWVIYAHASSGPIDGMSFDIRKSIMNRMTEFITIFFTTRENAVISLSKMISKGVVPYISDSDSFNITLSNKFVWHSMTALTDIWIMNVMIDQTLSIGYSTQGKPNTYGYFGRIDKGNLTGGRWQLKRYDPLVNQQDGSVDYSLPSTWTSPMPRGTLWPGQYALVYNTSYDVHYLSMESDVPSPYYLGTSPQTPAVDNYFPQYGLQYTFIYPFASPGENGSRIGSFASCTFNTKYLLESIKSINLRGGILYMTDLNGYMTASSSGQYPVYGPNTTTDLYPQTTGVTLPYGQFNYTNYPDKVVQTTGKALASRFKGYKNIPKSIDTFKVNIDGNTYIVSTLLFESYGLLVRIVTAIPESSFIGFTKSAVRNAAFTAMGVTVGVILIILLFTNICVTQPLQHSTNIMKLSISGSRNDKRSLFYSPDHDVSDTEDEKLMTYSASASSKQTGCSSEVPEITSVNDSTFWEKIKLKNIRLYFMPYEPKQVVKISEYYLDVVHEAARYLPKGLLHSGKNREIVKSSKINNKLVTMCLIKLVAFNSITANFRKQHISSVISEYTISMRRIIEKNGGHVLGSDPESLFAIWNAPEDLNQHQYLGMLSTFECNGKLLELNDSWKHRFKFPRIQHNIGIHVGEPMIGNIGGQGQLSYSCFGPDADITKQLVNLCDIYSISIICTEAMRISLTKIRADHLFAIRNLGKLSINSSIIVCHPVSTSLMDNFSNDVKMCVLCDKILMELNETEENKKLAEPLRQKLDDIIEIYPVLQQDQHVLNMKIECENNILSFTPQDK